MTTAGKKSRSRAPRKPKLEGSVESSSQWGHKKRPSRGRCVAEHAEEIGGALKWMGKFEWNPKIITHKVYLNKQNKQQKQKHKETNTNSNKNNKETRNKKGKPRFGNK